MATRVIGYIRVSTVEQGQSGLSLDAQRRKLTAYAEALELELVAIVEDVASAKTIERPGLQSALTELAAHRADGLLIAKLDRLTRRVVDLGEVVELANKQGWDLLSVADSIDTRSAAGRLVLNVLASVSQWEREAIGERTSAAMAELAAQGRYTGGKAPYGWTLQDDGALTAEPTEQSVIALANELRASGLSLRVIGRRLESQGLLPRQGGSWAASSVQCVLAARVAA